MANQSPQVSYWTKLMVWIGGGLGLILALGLTGVRMVLSNEPLGAERALGDLVFGVVYIMPFALSLWALRWKDATTQAAVWLAGGVLAFLASFSAFSGVSLVFLLTVPLLILAALLAATNAFLIGGIRSVLPIIPIAPVLAGMGVASFFALLALTPDPRCWVLNRYPDGRTVWESDPTAYIVIENLPGGGQRSSGGGGGVGGPAVNGVQRLQSTCTSDVISPIESAVSLGTWVIAIAGLEAIRRYRRIGATVEVGG